MKHYYQLTEKSQAFAEKIAAGINKDFPDQAMVKGDCCYIRDEYWDMCKAHVQKHATLKY